MISMDDIQIGAMFLYRMSIAYVIDVILTCTEDLKSVQDDPSFEIKTLSFYIDPTHQAIDICIGNYYITSSSALNPNGMLNIWVKLY